MIGKLIAAVAVIVAAAGCSSSGGGSTGISHSSSGNSASKSNAPFTTTYGQDAALVASHITGCTGVAAADVGNGAATGMVGKATCTLLGHEVVIYTWASESAESSSNQLIAGSLKYYATGTGWDQILGDDAAPDAQKAIANAVATALGGTTSTGTAS